MNLTGNYIMKKMYCINIFLEKSNDYMYMFLQSNTSILPTIDKMYETFIH